MIDSAGLGKVLIAIGATVAVVGALLLLAERVPGLSHLFSWMGNLPGDVSIKRDRFSFFFPLTTSILLSVVLSLVLYFLSWLLRR